MTAAPPTPRPVAPSRPSVASQGDEVSTRQRILDAAIDLFTEKSYDGTSLREIAEQVGVTKAALYHHFASKAEIVSALLEPLTDEQRKWLDRFDDTPTDEEWAEALGEVIDWMVDNQRVFQVFERNREAFEARDDHGVEHARMHERVDRVIGNPAIDPRRRIRLSAALGAAVAIAPLGSGEVLADIDTDVVRAEFRAAVRRALDL